MHFFSQQKTRFSLPGCLSLFIVTLLFFLLVTSANAYSVVLAWDPNSEQNLEGYVLYVDAETTEMPYEYVDTYPLEIIDPNNPSVRITDLQNDIAYYFVVTAYDADGNESDFSSEICVMNGQACPDSDEPADEPGDVSADEPADQSQRSYWMSQWLPRFFRSTDEPADEPTGW